MNNFFLLTCLLFFTNLARANSCLSNNIVSTFTPTEAKHFKIDYYQNYKIISIDKYQYLLSDNLQKINCEFPFKIKTPVRKVAMTSTTYLPTLILMDEVDSLRAFQNTDYIYSNTFESKEIENLPFELKIEQLIKLKIDLVMAYQENIAAKDKMPLFYKFNIPLVLNLDLLETSPLARAEWMVYIASFYNKERRAMDLFGQILSNYYKKSKNIKYRKKVLIGDIQNGKWVTPGALSDLGKMVTDAGGELIIKINSRETQSLPLEYIYKNKLNADIWITNNTWLKKSDFKSDSRYNVIKAKKIFNFNKKVNAKGSNDYWEMGLQRPDLILNDLINIFENNYNQLQWYRELE